MNLLKILSFYLFTVLLFLGSCKKAQVDNISPVIDPTEVKNVSDMNQKFGWDIFQKELSANPNENVLISPWSIQTALQMALNGADHNTLNEMLKILECDNCTTELINKQQTLLTSLMENQSGKALLTSANGLFYDSNRLTVFEPFVNNIKQYYNADPHKFDFDKAEESKVAINKWVKEKTNGKIDGILETITHYDIAFLINAIHFKADWLKGFDPKLTYKADFTSKSGTKLDANFVTADDEFNIGTDGIYNMVDIPFIDSTYSIAFIQPATKKLDPEWANKIGNNIVKGLFNTLTKERILLSFPKVKMNYKNNLVESLEALGMKDAFSDERADFTKLGTSNGNIYITQVVHKSILEIDEKGAEGAAVSSIGFGTTSLPPTYTYNNPFILVLRHVATNTILFIGYVNNPT